MRSILKYILSGCALALSLSSCLTEKQEICDSYIKFVYDYTLDGADLFSYQVSNVDLFLFDEAGIFLTRLSATAPGGTFPSGYRMQLPLGLERAKQVIAWAGLSNQITLGSLQEGVSTVAELTAKIADAYGQEVDQKLHPLWYGELLSSRGKGVNIEYLDEEHTVSLMKLSKTFRIVIKITDKDLPVENEILDFKITSRNGSYSHLAEPNSTSIYTYEPYLIEREIRPGCTAVEISTLRLMASAYTGSQLTISNNDASIVEDLNDALDMLMLSEYAAKTWSFQEYLDRKDKYEFVILVHRGVSDLFFSGFLTVNEWLVRENEFNQIP